MSPSSDDMLAQVLTDAAEQTKKTMRYGSGKANAITSSDSLLDTVIDIEKNLLAIIIDRVALRQMSAEQARLLAERFISLLPVSDMHDLVQKLRVLKTTNSETASLYVHYAKSYDAQQASEKLAVLSRLIHAGNIEEAIDIARGKGK